MLILFLQHMKQNWLLLGFRNMESMILYRSKEKKECKSNTEILQKQIEKCTIVEIPKYRHGELAIGNPYKHLEYLKKLMSQGSI